MPRPAPFMSTPVSSTLQVAAEALILAQLSRYGLEASFTLGDSYHGRKLIVANVRTFTYVCVHVSIDGAWSVTHPIKRAKDGKTATTAAHAALDMWLADVDPRTIMCFVQFKDVSDDCLPRCYLARSNEVARALKAAQDGFGDYVLYEERTYTKGRCAGLTDRVPSEWTLSSSRAIQLLTL